MTLRREGAFAPSVFSFVNAKTVVLCKMLQCQNLHDKFVEFAQTKKCNFRQRVNMGEKPKKTTENGQKTPQKSALVLACARAFALKMKKSPEKSPKRA